MNEDPSLPTFAVIAPLSAPRQPDFSFEREPKPERRAFEDLVIEVYGQRPVIGADIGVNKAALDTYYLDGLLCYLHPYLNQKEGDFVELFCGNTDDPVAITSVSEEEADKGAKIPLFIPRARLPDGVIFPVFFRLTRYSGGNYEETPRYSLLVDTIPPAGPYDPIPSTPWHEELAPPQPPQFVIDFGVDKDTAEHGVPITIAPYTLDESTPHSWKMAEHDKIRLFIGGVLVTPVHSVTWDEANNRLPLTVTIYYETWLKVGDGQKVLEYEVIDQCGNYSVKWSPQVVLKVNIGNDDRPRLPYAYIEESVEFGEEFDTVDYDLIGEDDDATIVITTIRQGYLLGDSVSVTLEGRTAEGATIRETIDYPLKDADVRRNIELPLRNEILRELVGGTAVLSYARIRAGSDPQPSEVNRLVILGSILNRLAPPQVIEAIGDFLDPTSLLATVEISPYTGQQSSDRVDLYLLGTRANEDLEFWHFFKMAGSSNVPVLFHLQHDLDIDIAGLNGGKLELHYVVTNAEGDRESFHALLSVGEATATLPPPNVPEAPDGVLDPESSIRGATVVVPRAANLEEGDLLSVYWQGSKPGGSFRYRKFEVTRAWLDSDIPFPIEREYVDANKGGSVKAFYIVERGREPVRYSHVNHIKVGVELALEKPEVLETTEPGGNLLNPITAQNAVTIRVRYDEMKNSDNIQPYWKGVAGIGSPNIDSKPGNVAQGYVDFTLPGDSAVGPNIGKQVEVSYEVSNSGASQSSDHLDLTIQTLPVSALPPLQILQASSGQVDVNGTVTFRVDAWPFYRQGDRVWLALESDNPDGTLNRLPIWTASTIQPSEFNQKFLIRVITNIPAHAQWLRALEHGTQLRVTFKVVFGGGSNEAEALVFPPLSLNVVNQAETPTITSVKNAAGGEIANGSTVVTTTVTLTGTAANGQQVEIRDGTTVMGTATANANGAWTSSALTVTNKAYSLTARGVYGSGPVSTPPRTFTVTASATPTITSVKNAAGGEIANGATVVTATVTLTGTAANGQQVEIRDGTTVMGTATANANGAWTSSALTVTNKAYSLTARGVYGSNPVSTPPRTFTVTASATPTITSVKNAAGGEITNGSTVITATVTLTGTAANGQQVEIRDGSNVLRTVTANANGIWTTTPALTVTAKGYSITARGVYGSNPVSTPPRTFTVVSEVKPVITGVHTSTGASVPHNGTTDQRSLTISGTATRSSTIEVRNGGDILLSAGVNGSGAWSDHINNLTLKKYDLVAKIVGGTLSSDIRTFTVINPAPPLVFDTSPVTLSGKIYMLSESTTHPAVIPGTTIQRQATGGTPPYTYSSSSGNVIVDRNNGHARVRKNGSATITVTDSRGQSKSYVITVTGVITCYIHGVCDYALALQRAAIGGNRIPPIEELRDIYNMYAGRWPVESQGFYWSNTSSAANYRFTKNLIDGQELSTGEWIQVRLVALGT